MDGQPADAPEGARVKVWDLGVRAFHWLLACSIAVLWFTAEEARDLHETLGLAVLALLGLRLAWGLVGSRHARFASFVRGPRVVARYAAEVLAHRAPRFLGHNPLGAAMVLLLIGTVAATGATGWLMGTDRFFGEEWVEELHEWLADGLIVLVVLHVAGVVHASWAQRENLVRAMFTGRKRAPQPGDVD